MARNAELVRQWEILREIDAARTGIPIAKLASTRKVHVRTIRRDLDALCRAGFPLFDDKVNGTSMWKLRAKPFRGLEETGLSILEMCALYFSRSLLQTLGGAPFEEEMNRAFAKLERALPAASRRFLDQLPLLIKTKATRAEEARRPEVARGARSPPRRLPLPSSRRHALSLRIVATHEGLRDRAAARVLRGRRDLRDGLGAGVRRDADLRAGAHPDARREGRPVRAAGAAAGAVRELARRVLRQSGAGRDRVRRAVRRLRPRAGVAPLAGDRRRRETARSCFASACRTTGRCARGFSASARPRGCWRPRSSRRRSTRRSKPPRSGTRRARSGQALRLAHARSGQRSSRCSA